MKSNHHPNRVKMLCLLLILSIANAIHAQALIYEDRYSGYVKKLVAGATDIDYQDFRYSFLKSEQFKVARTKSTDYNRAKEEVYRYLDSLDYAGIVKASKRMLDINYTSMFAHKMLRQTYQLMGDSVLAQKHSAIQMGLLHSIVDFGDGLSCETAWPVVQIEEEYFILQMLGCKVEEQRPVFEGGICDCMHVVEDGEKKVYYFEVSRIFEAYGI